MQSTYSDQSVKAGFLKRNKGIFITLIVLSALEILAQTVIRIPNPPPEGK